MAVKSVRTRNRGKDNILFFTHNAFTAQNQVERIIHKANKSKYNKRK